MNLDSDPAVTMTMVAWATPEPIRWFNRVPHRFAERKARQVQALVDELEADGAKVLEICQTPLVTAVKVMHVEEEG